jgi:preprotein translocase subunit SecG
MTVIAALLLAFFLVIGLLLGLAYREAEQDFPSAHGGKRKAGHS